MRLYLNGIQEASSGSLGSATVNDSSATMNIGALTSSGSTHTGCYISNARLVNARCLNPDGTTLTPSTTALTNVTNTKLLCCQSNTSAIAAAVSPSTPIANGNVAATNFNPFNTDINTVMGQETGYCTWNPVCISTSSNSLSQGNLKATHTASTLSLIHI